MFKEFREFAMRGNIIDLAVGVIIGGAFQKIVNSLVSDIIMPIVSVFIGRIDFTNMNLNISNISIKYGSFITAIINFLTIAFAVFLFVRYVNKLNRQLTKMSEENIEKLKKKGKWIHKKKKIEEITKEPTIKTCPYCLSEINIKAIRCPNCTSILEKDNINSDIVDQANTN